MNIISLPSASFFVSTKFKKNYKVHLSTYNVDEAVIFPHVNGLYINEECKEIGIDVCGAADGHAYRTHKFSYEGEYCMLAVNDEDAIVINVDSFSKINRIGEDK